MASTKSDTTGRETVSEILKGKLRKVADEPEDGIDTLQIPFGVCR